MHVDSSKYCMLLFCMRKSTVCSSQGEHMLSETHKAPDLSDNAPHPGDELATKILFSRKQTTYPRDGSTMRRSIAGSVYTRLACMKAQQNVHAVNMALGCCCHHCSTTSRVWCVCEGTTRQQGPHGTALPCCSCSQQRTGILHKHNPYQQSMQ